MPPLMSNKDQEILKELVQRPTLNPSQALAVRQVLDESCITALTGGAGRGKSETLVAYIIAVLWQQGHLVAQNPDPANLGTINMGKKLGGPEGDTPPRACVPTPTSSFWQVVVRVKETPKQWHGHRTRPSNTTMFRGNLLARKCIAMIRTGFAAPAPCNSFCTARVAGPVSGTTVPDEQAAGYNHACLVHRGGGGLGYYHSSAHPLPDPILNNPIRIVDLDGTSWWGELEDTLGPEDLGRMYSDVQQHAN